MGPWGWKRLRRMSMMNRHIGTVIVAPLTTMTRAYPTRVSCALQGKKGQVVLDQIRIVDKKCLVKCIGMVEQRVQGRVCQILQELFAM